MGNSTGGGGLFGGGATIRVGVDNSHLTSGQICTGTIYLIVHSNELSCSELRLQLTGMEDTSVEYQVMVQHGDSVHMETRVARQRLPFLNNPYLISVIPDGKLTKGQHEFPFSIYLPPELPPTMSHGRRRNSCSIEYKLETHLVRPGILKFDVKHTISVTVLPPAINYTPIRTIAQPCSTTVNVCFCFNKGSMMLGAATNHIFQAGQPTDVTYLLKNNSTIEPSDVEIEVHQECSWQARGRDRSTHTARSNSVIGRARISCSGRAGIAVPPPNSDGQVVPVNYDSELRFFADALRGNQKGIEEAKLTAMFGDAQVHVDPNAEMSMRSTLIEVNHYITVLARTPLFITDPNTKLNVKCGRVGAGYNAPPQVCDSRPPDLPADWSPTVQEKVEFAAVSCVQTPGNHDDDDDDPDDDDDDYVPVAKAPAIIAGETSKDPAEAIGVESLLTALRTTLGPLSIINRWLNYSEQNSTYSFTPDDLANVFS